MHELSLCRAILKKISQISLPKKSQTIIAIHLRIGALSCIDVAALEFCFATIAKSTIAAQASLQCQIETGVALCHACHQCYPVHTLFSFCPNCSSKNTELIKGNEFILTQIEVQ